MQLTIFNQPKFQVHRHEKPRESLQYLDRKRLAGNCKILYTAFMRGERLSSANSPVPEFRRRRQNLTDDNGVRMHWEKSPTGAMKIWFCTAEDLEYNKYL